MWTEGKSHLIADAFSRRPTGPPKETLKLCHLTEVPLSIMPTVEEAASDERHQDIIEAIRNRSNIHNLPPTHPAKHL